MNDDEREETAWERAMREHEAALATAWRVRVRLGECRHMVSWHGTVEDGAVGKILPVGPKNGHPADHTYWVWFDRPIWGRVAWSYCAAELIPITFEERLAEMASTQDAPDLPYICYEVAPLSPARPTPGTGGVSTSAQSPTI